MTPVPAVAILEAAKPSRSETMSPQFPATHFRRASEIDALIDPHNPMQGQLSVTADGEIFYYELSREALTQLADQIEQQLSDVPTRARQ